MQSDGKILAGGFFGTIGGQTRHNLARLDATTGLADSFNPNASDEVHSIAVQADGKVLASGFFMIIGGQPRNSIARLDSTTGAADSFNPNADNGVFSIAVQADGKILAGGDFFSIGGQSRHHIARLDATTGLADSFNPNANNNILAIAVQADGKVLAGGGFATLAPNGGGPVTRNHMARLETDGRLDRTLNLGTVGNFVVATAVQPDGKILIGGIFTTVLGVARNNIARLNPDGTLDTAFAPNADSNVYSIAVQADGNILAGGLFSSIGGQTRNRIARLDATTGLADSFNPNANGEVDSIAVQADGKILAGGLFHGANSIGGQTRNHIARLDATTGLADSFDPNANDDVISITVQTDGKILAGGFFNGANSIGGQTRNHIARLDAVTGLADSFDPDASDAVISVAVQADGKVLAGGYFNFIGGELRNRIARLNATTGLPDSFDPHASNDVFSIAVQADGKVLAGGSFDNVGGQIRNHIARLDATTGLADSFDPNANSIVISIAALADGKILASGDFTSIGGQTRSLFSRLSNDTAALQNLVVTQTTITWARSGSSPQFTRVTFESSPDRVNYTFLGNGVSSGSNWTLTGLSLLIGQNIYIRARGYYRSGGYNGSESLTESVRNIFLTGPDPTPTSTPTPTQTATPTPSPTPTPTPTQTATPTPSPAVTPTATQSPTSTPIPSLTPTATPSPAPTLTPTPTPSPTPAAQAINLSTRMRVQTGDNVGIGGFIITGTAQKHVLLRAIGPSLAQFGVPGVLADPVMELHGPAGFATITNDNWRDDPAQEALIIASGIPPTNNLESAIDATLIPGSYTAIVRGKNNTAGVALVEVYDLSQPVDSKLANLSTRALVGTGSDIVIAGFILGAHSGVDRIVLRGIGPSLSTFPFPNVLADPALELRNNDGALVAFNNDWQEDPAQAAELIAAGLAPSQPLEAAIAVTLPPGLYTALLTGRDNGSGVGVVEVYDRGGL